MTSIDNKVQHVRDALKKAHREHTCHWPGCTQNVPPAVWGCRPHWYALPSVLRRKVWQTYRTGQEETQTPSRAYIEVAREVQAWIEKHIASGEPNRPVPTPTGNGILRGKQEGLF